MKERILLVNNINGTELIRTLARFGSKQFLLRTFNSTELAREGLIKSGKTLDETFLSRNEEVYVIDRFLKENAYFSVSSFSDSDSLARTLYSLRMMVTEDEEKTVTERLADGEFKDKNEAIAEIYLKYITYLKENHLIDSIGLIRRAIDMADKIGSEFIILKEYPIEPLERKLIDALSLKEVKEISVLELFGEKERDLKIAEYVRAYGTVNELDDILSFIYTKGIAFDKCLIVTPKDSYQQYIYNLALSNDLPVTYGNGLSITNSSAYGLLKMIIEHENNEYGIDTLRGLLFSSLIDREKLLNDLDSDEKKLEDLVKISGSLRLSFREDVNDDRYLSFEPNGLKDRHKYKHVDSVRKLKDIFNKGIVSFLREYAVIRNRTDSEGLQLICRNIEEYLHECGDDVGKLLPVLSGKYIARDLSKEGHIHVSNIRNALSCLREYVFVTGMSSSLFPGQPKENYLLLDSDIRLFTEEGHTSDKILEEKISQLNDLLEVASGLGCHIKMSYSDFNIAGLKSENPSSFLFDTYKREHPADDYKAFNDAFHNVSYFKHGLKKEERMGNAYIEGKEIVSVTAEEKLSGSLPKIEERFAPTQIETYFACPRRFYLQYVLGVKDIEEDDPYTVINAADIGTLYHGLMEESANRDMSLEDFLKLSDKAFEEYLTLRPEIHEDAKARAKADFLDMCAKGYDLDPGNHVEAAERFTKAECYGVKIMGFPDRIEKDKDGHYLIADFKTGREIKHEGEDPLSCLQVLLYAHMAREELGYDIRYCQYRYPRLSYTVNCDFNDKNEDELASLMAVFRNALKTGSFPVAEEDAQKDACRYCHYASICGKEEGGEEDE